MGSLMPLRLNLQNSTGIGDNPNDYLLEVSRSIATIRHSFHRMNSVIRKDVTLIQSSVGSMADTIHVQLGQLNEQVEVC